MVTNFALNPFKKGKKGEIEKIKQVKVEKSPEVEKVLKIYYDFVEDSFNYFDTEKEINSLGKIVLSPPQITQFLTFILKYHPRNEITGHFTSKLIQDSYGAGNNNFLLDTNSFDPKHNPNEDSEKIGIYSLVNQMSMRIHANYFLCYNLKGKKHNPIKITLNGDFGNSCARKLEWCVVDLYGDAHQLFGADSRNSTFNIFGNVAEALASASYCCKYNIKGNVADYCGESSSRCDFFIDGIMGSAENNQKLNNYKITDPNSYEKLLKIVYKRNNVQLVDTNENVIKEKRND